jgi:predicted  nucleic acid-binding Zn-ribbon protein
VHCTRFKVNELDIAKNQWEQMKEKIVILECEKQDLEVKVSNLESYINDGKTNDQQQKILEEIKTMIEGTYYIYFWAKFVYTRQVVAKYRFN